MMAATETGVKGMSRLEGENHKFGSENAELRCRRCLGGGESRTVGNPLMEHDFGLCIKVTA